MIKISYYTYCICCITKYNKYKYINIEKKNNEHVQYMRTDKRQRGHEIRKGQGKVGKGRENNT